MKHLRMLMPLVLAIAIISISQAHAYPVEDFANRAQSLSTGSSEAHLFTRTQSLSGEPSDLASAVALFTEYRSAIHPGAFLLHNGARTKKVAILLHGMTMSADQLEPIGQYLLSKGINSFSLSLAGHHSPGGGYNQNIPQNKDFNYRDWNTDLEFGLALAKTLGDEVILVGFSMGGLIATYGATVFPDQVKATIVLGPALRANLDHSALACMGNAILDMGFFRSKATASEQRWIHIGCQVQKMITEIQSHGSGLGDETNGFYENYERVFKNLKTPMMVVYTANDTYVDSGTIKFMIDSMGIKPTVLYHGNSLPHVRLDRLDIPNPEGRTLRQTFDEFLERSDVK